MIRKNISSLLISTLLCANLLAEETSATAAVAQESSPSPTVQQTQETAALDTDLSDTAAEKIALISEAFGHIIAKHIDSLGVDFDLARLVKGLQDAGQGLSPPMSDIECIDAITKSRQEAFNAIASSNLEKANQFMQENAKKEKISVLEEGKLHIRIDHEGNGPIVEKGCTPVIHYTGKFVDGAIFGASKEDDLVTLDETIPGFGRGLLGMKQGEKRTIFIHPDLAYGTMGQLPPNSLLIFEIELIKANAEPAKEVAAPILPEAASDKTAALETSSEVEKK